MALHQHRLTVAADRLIDGYERCGTGTFVSGLTDPRLVSAVVLLPDGGNLASSRGAHVRARIDGEIVTVEVSGGINGRVEILVTLDA